MIHESINVVAHIFNAPKQITHGAYMVVRNIDAELWYYGEYEDEEKAIEVARKLDNGLVLYCKAAYSEDEEGK